MLCRSVTFIGSDTPHLQVADLMEGIHASTQGGAFICPGQLTLLRVKCNSVMSIVNFVSALDGGYTMLSLPSTLREHAELIFGDIRWSSEHTLEDQVRCIESVGGSVCRGGTYTDVDTVDDVRSLDQLCREQVSGGSETPCPETFAVIRDIFK